jgi:outer membrane immunogenic protein
MKKIAISVSALALLAAAQANAADMYRASEGAVGYKDEPYTPLWTGFYVGASGGYASGDIKSTLSAVNAAGYTNYTTSTAGAIDAFASGQLDSSIGIVSGKIGYDRQYGHLVLGLEADFSYLGLNESKAINGNPFGGSPWYADFREDASSDWLLTVRPKLGLAFDRFLPYVTGGLAYGDVKFRYTESEWNPDGFGIGAAAASKSVNQVGWAAGAGVNYELTRNWILNAEYLHVDLGSVNVTGAVLDYGVPVAYQHFNTSYQYDIGRAGISYRFGSGYEPLK